jgi:hypothetical protein
MRGGALELWVLASPRYLSNEPSLASTTVIRREDPDSLLFLPSASNCPDIDARLRGLQRDKDGTSLRGHCLAPTGMHRAEEHRSQEE